MLSLCILIQRGKRVTPLAFCLRVIMNEKPLNLEKRRHLVSYLLFLLIYACNHLKLNFGGGYEMKMQKLCPGK